MPEPEKEELTPEQRELLAKAAAEAEKEIEKRFTGFNKKCQVDDSCGPRVEINGILFCPCCDFVRFDENKTTARANPPQKKD